MKGSPFLNRISIIVVSSLWLFMVFTLLTQRNYDFPSSPSNPILTTTHSLDTPLAKVTDLHRPVRARATLVLPKRTYPPSPVLPPPPLTEIAHNMTLYLHELHRRLGELAGPHVSPPVVWETFLEVTRAMPMVWDEENR